MIAPQRRRLNAGALSRNFRWPLGSLVLLGRSGLTAVKTGGVISLDRILAPGRNPPAGDLLRALTDAIGCAPDPLTVPAAGRLMAGHLG